MPPFILVLATAGLLVSQHLVRTSRAQTITGKGFRPTKVPLGRWRPLGMAVAAAFFIVTAVLPMLILLWSSITDGYRAPSIDALSHLTFDNYTRMFDTPSLLASARNSLLSAVLSALIVTAVATVVAFITVRTRTRGRGVLDLLAMVPIAVPSIILGVGILFWYLVIPVPVHLYGTLAILVIAYVTVGLPYSTQYMVAGMNQIHQDMEDASSTSGGTWGKTIWKIYLPLLRPALLASVLWAVMLAFREVSGIILLYTDDNQVLAVTVYNLWSNGNSDPLVAALGVLSSGTAPAPPHWPGPAGRPASRSATAGGAICSWFGSLLAPSRGSHAAGLGRAQLRVGVKRPSRRSSHRRRTAGPRSHRNWRLRPGRPPHQPSRWPATNAPACLGWSLRRTRRVPPSTADSGSCWSHRNRR